MKKQIVSETKQYQPSFPDELLLDDTPKVNSFNGVTSDGVARAIAGASGEVPQVTESDNGKVLTAIYDEGGAAVEWAESQGGDVDQTYDATSTNAQSGVAVAQALAAIPSPEEVSVVSFGTANTEVTFLKSPNVKMVIASPEVNQTGLTALTYDRGVGTSINQNTTFLMFKLDGKPPYLTGNSGGELVISEDLAFPVTSQGAWGNNLLVFPVIPSDPRYGMMAINIQGSPIVGGVIKAGTYTLVTSTAHPPLSSDYSDLAVLIQVGGSSQSVIDTAQQFLIDNASKFSIKWRGETYRATIPSTNNLVPAYTSTDAGKVLQVQNDGTLAWVTLS